jgi:hypothetical protein
MRARHIIVSVLLLGLLLALPAAASAKGGNGQAIGQDAVRLALTKCSNAGVGQDGQYENGVQGSLYVRVSDCLHKELGSTYSFAEIEAIVAQSACELHIIVFECEISPGNSAGSHGNNG